ncbi:MAG: transglutaminase family protein, partial [Tsuneonella suprasediminis]
MRLSISHTTRYTFKEPVIHALQRLRLTPKETQGQEILDWQMTYENAEPELQYEDQHHNTVNLVSVKPDSRLVTVTCTGTVRTRDEAGVIGRHSGHLPLWSFLGQTKLTRPGEKMKALVDELGDPAGDKLGYLHNLSRLIAEKVNYEVGTTGVDTTAEDAVIAGSGVCQDHAHIFIGAARARNIP